MRMQRSVSVFVLLAMVIGMALPLGIQSAYADCSPDPAPDGSTVVCDAIDLDGLTAGDMVTVQVTEDGAVYDTASPTEHVITTEDDATISVEGTVTAAGSGDAIHTGDDAVITISEDGTVVSENADAIDVQDNAYIQNNGLVDANIDHAIEAGASVEVENNGTLEAAGDVVLAGDGATVVNNGSITSTYADGIDVGSGADITNNGTITTVYAGNGIELDGGVVTNTSTIAADCNGIEATANVRITNTGTITSENCDVIQGGDRVQVVNDGSISTGEGNNNTAVELGDLGFVRNNGEISADCMAVRGDIYTNVQNHGEITSESCDGVVATVGNISNDGTITAGDDGLDIDRGSVFNHNGGVISGEDTGIDINGGVEGDYGDTFVSNQVESTVIGGVGINAEHADNTKSQSVYNEGTIEGTSGTAVALGAGNDFFSGAIGTYGEEGQTHTFESQAVGVVNGGADEDTFEIDYHYNGDDAEAVAEADRIESIASTASTQNCPCTISFSVMGLSFNYTYTNFEKITFKKSCWDFGTGSCGGGYYASAAPVANLPAETTLVAEAVASQVEIAAPAETAPVAQVVAVEAAPVMAEVVSVAVEAAPVQSSAAPVVAVSASNGFETLSLPAFAVQINFGW